MAFENLGAFLKSYKLFVEKNDINLAPSVVTALDKLDSNKDAGKRKALADAAVAALTKWETDQKLTKFADDIKKFKESLTADPSKPGAPPAPPPPPPPPPQPYKKTTFQVDYLNAIKELGAIGKLAELDASKTMADAKPVAAAAQKWLERDVATLDAAIKACTDKDEKLKLQQLSSLIRGILMKVKDLQK